MFRFALALAVPLLKIISFLGIVLLASILLYSYLRVALVPKALIDEELHFDYTAAQPIARLRVSAASQQWNDNIYAAQAKMKISGFDSGSYNYLRLHESSSIPAPQYLKAGHLYDVDVVFSIVKSARSFSIGTMPVTARLVGSHGQVAASSARAVVMPYQSPASLLVESLLLLPARMLGYLPTHESVSVRVNFMRGFREPVASTGDTATATQAASTEDMVSGMGPAFPIASRASTDVVEVLLSAPAMDVLSAHLTVMPRLVGIT